jgi:hypothetical protein
MLLGIWPSVGVLLGETEGLPEGLKDGWEDRLLVGASLGTWEMVGPMEGLPLGPDRSELLLKTVALKIAGPQPICAPAL